MADALDAFSRSRGRVVTASTVSAFMEELFGAQRERYQTWLEEIRSERPVPTPEESFRGPSTVDDNALIVGGDNGPVTDRKADRPRLPADRTSDVRGFEDSLDGKRPDPFVKKPENPKKPDTDTRDDRRAWIWGVLLLVVVVGTAWWATHKM
jgi:hypothetical protein